MRVKRIIDISISGILLVALSPLMVILAVLIRADSKGKVIFRQQRIGLNCMPFTMYKFRTMTDSTASSEVGRYLREDEEGYTNIGKQLRRFALDELPQLWNVLKGDMSIVGPRPTLGYQVDKYNEFQRKRMGIKPGLTGWAQVNGRNKLTWPERIELDVWYAENWSLWLDIRIMLMTIPALLIKEYAFAADNIETDEIVRIEG